MRDEEQKEASKSNKKVREIKVSHSDYISVDLRPLYVDGEYIKLVKSFHGRE